MCPNVVKVALAAAFLLGLAFVIPAASRGGGRIEPRVPLSQTTTQGEAKSHVPSGLNIFAAEPADTPKRLIHPLPLLNVAPIAAIGDQIPFECNVPITARIDNPIESDFFIFSVIDNEAVSISIGNPPAPNFRALGRLLKGDGTSAGGACGNFALAANGKYDCGPLPASGNPYRVEVIDQFQDATGTYYMHLQRLTAAAACEATPLLCDVVLDGNISSPVESDLLSFSVRDNEIVSFSIGNPSTPNFRALARLLKGDGAPVTGPCGGFALAANGKYDCGPLPSANNPYRVEVIDQFHDATGDYYLHLQRLTAPAACETTPLVCDVTLNGTINRPVETDLASFSVSDNEIISLSISNPSTPNFRALGRLLKADGTPVAGPCGSFALAANGKYDCGPLPASGSPYSVEVIDQFYDATGDYYIHLQRLTAAAACEITPLIRGVPFTGNIESPVETDLLSFHVRDNADEMVSISVGNPPAPNFRALGRLLKGDGTAAGGACGNFSLAATGIYNCGPLPASGNPYRVEVIDQFHDATGSYNIAVNFLTTGCPTISLAPRPLTVAVGTNGEMTVTISPTQSADTVVQLSSSNLGVAKVPDSVTIRPNQPSASFAVMGMSAGSATITATLPQNLGSRTATAAVTVFSPGTSQIEIIPPSPTTNDHIYARVSGSWPNTCAPLNPVRTRTGTDIRIAASGSGHGCAQVATSWSHTVDIGPLPLGAYNVAVTYNGAEIGRRSFNVTAPPTPRALRVVGVNAAPGGSVSVPIELASQGDENALGFTLLFDRDVLSNPQATLGADAVGAALNQNPNQAGQGRFGVTLALPAGQRFAAGARRVAVVTFAVAAGAMTISELRFGDQPIGREVAGVNADFLSTAFQPGAVVIPGYEADVMPRPTGDNNGTVTIADWTQVGRIVAGLDSIANDGEFQRTDCAPKETKGDGRLTVADWVQTGRYAAILDTVMTAGGPTSSSAPPPTTLAHADERDATAELNAARARIVRPVRVSSGPGQNSVFSIELDAQGNENALGFSLHFDPGQWRFVSAVAGSDALAATSHVNDHQAASGRLGLTLALPTGQTWPAGARKLLVITFSPATGNNADAPTLGFGDQPVIRETVDDGANRLSTFWAARVVVAVSAASFSGPELAGEALAAAFGSHLATATEMASTPLSTMLAGTTVRIVDSIGKESLAVLLFVSPSQINFQMPAGMAEGMATVIITSADGTTSVGALQLARVAPGLFTANASGRGLAAAVILRVGANGSQSFEPVGEFDPLQNRFVPRPIDLGPEGEQVFLILFGTGFRARVDLAAVTVEVGSVGVRTDYAGAAPGFVGLDQANVLLPRSLMGRGEVDVVLTVEGKAANRVQVSIR